MAAALQRAKVNVMPCARQTIACRQGSTAKVSVTVKRLMLFSLRRRFGRGTLNNASNYRTNGLTDY